MMVWWTWGRLLKALLFGLALATAGRFFADQSWWLDILADFQVQYVAGAVALLLASLLVRRIKEAALALVLLAVNVAILAPHVGPLFPVAAAPVLVGQAAMKVVSFNLKFDNRNTAAALDFLRRENADVVTVMEVTKEWRHALEQLKDIYPHQFYGPLCRCPGDIPHTDGVLAKRPWREVKAERSPLTGRSFAVWARFASVQPDKAADLVIAGVHLINPLIYPAGYQITEAVRLASILRGLPGPVIVTGDFNMTPFSARFGTLLRETGLRRADGGINASWPTWLTPLGLPLDHILVNAKVGHAAMWVGPRLGSDHRPIIARLDLSR
ncbi:MAG: endonuclease/exonuclease/phosphatase family protein [Proteobacteria bacterium]|nr:endonuclease/exonuclease/phosphatase family protein [Pseudomonadota bacterium]